MRHDKSTIAQLKCRIERLVAQVEGVRNPHERTLWKKHIQQLRAQLAAGLRQLHGEGEVDASGELDG